MTVFCGFSRSHFYEVMTYFLVTFCTLDTETQGRSQLIILNPGEFLKSLCYKSLPETGASAPGEGGPWVRFYSALARVDTSFCSWHGALSPVPVCPRTWQNVLLHLMANSLSVKPAVGSAVLRPSLAFPCHLVLSVLIFLTFWHLSTYLQGISYRMVSLIGETRDINTSRSKMREFC